MSVKCIKCIHLENSENGPAMYRCEEYRINIYDPEISVICNRFKEVEKKTTE